MITPTLDDTSWIRFLARIRRSIGNRQQRIAMALSNSAELVVTRAKTHYLTGAALKVRTGRLRSSVTKSPAAGANISGNMMQVFVGTKVRYGKSW